MSGLEDAIRASLEKLGPLPTMEEAAAAKNLSVDKTSLAYWFPKLVDASIPVPQTILVPLTDDARRAIWATFDGEQAGDPQSFFAALRAAAEEVGYPAFLRTAQTSAKHCWDKSCFIRNHDDFPSHVTQIVEFSECASLIGLDWELWAVREMLPSIIYGHCPKYDNMPVAKEFRFFVADGEVRCFHPYWPLESLRTGGWRGTAEDYAKLCDPDEHAEELRALAVRVSTAIAGAWSVDILQTERGWYVTDMAEAHKSFHWEGCEKS
ncbi:MAG TPA: ATP-grasp domain-containing protein [Candidatus Acidoferrales bacterium]|nr:ATP-grasp domain-containing protein [Candidatus Acidoferrales bacterium]